MYHLLPVILKDDNYFLLAARVEDRIAGSLVGIICHDLFGECLPYMIVENVIVTRNLCGQGIGKALMTNIEEIAKIRGCRYITLISSRNKMESWKFYSSIGYISDNFKVFKKYFNTIEPQHTNA
jgi:ribosomal protein S18 acetylase RimI-like enzyme